MALSIRRWLADWSLALPLLALAAAMLAAPLCAIFLDSFIGRKGGFTLANWSAFLSSRAAVRALWHSLLLGAVVATFALLVGGPLAWFISQASRRTRSVQIGILNVASNFSGIGLGFAYTAALGTFGLVTLAARQSGLDIAPPAPSSFWGMVIAYEYSSVPMFVILSLPAMGLVRTEHWEAAQTASATRWQFWRHIGLPVLAPFLAATWLLIFTWSLGLYGLPLALSAATPAKFSLITTEMGRSLLGSLFGENLMPVYAAVLMILAVISLVAYRSIVRRATRWLV